MVSRLNPVRFRIAFLSKTYQLGDTVNVRVDIVAPRAMTIREAHLGIECQIRYTEIRSAYSRRDVFDHRRTGVALGRPLQTINTSVEVEQSDTYDGPTFLVNQQLQAGRHQRSVRLKIPSELGRNGEYAKSITRAIFCWRVVFTADVSLARDLTLSKPIDIAVS